MEPAVARSTWRNAEPIHTMIYFAPEAQERYEALGLRPEGLSLSTAEARQRYGTTAPPSRMGYFASRSAAFGAAPAEVVTSSFFNFCPALVASVIPEAWTIADPAKVLDARFGAADAALRRALGDEVGAPNVVEAATLARRAAQAACEHPEGRPLFAAHASLPWPDEAHLVLWHAQTLLREFRGDGHIAALLVEGLTGVDAVVIHTATGDLGPNSARLKESRGWPDDEWTSALERMRSRGLVADEASGAGEAGGGAGELSLTDAGRVHRQWVEDRTDVLSLAAYDALGDDGCARLRELARPLSSAIIDAGLFPLSGARGRFLAED